MLERIMLQPDEPDMDLPFTLRGISSMDKPLSYISRMIRKDKVDFDSRNLIIVPYLSSGSTMEPESFNMFAKAYQDYLLRSEASSGYGLNGGILALRELAYICIFADMYGAEHRVDWDSHLLNAFIDSSNYGPAMNLFSHYVMQEGLLLRRFISSNTIN